MKSIKVLCLLFHILCCFLTVISQAQDTLKPGKTLYNNETLVSKSGVFELGLFSFGESRSSHLYLGIWFKNDKTKRPVWIGNREDPLVDSSGFLRIRYDGNLLLSDRRAFPFVVNNGELATSNETVCKILDSGNLVLIEGKKTVWQSFDYPTDTFLPGMKLGLSNRGTDHLKIQFLIAWISPFLPGIGQFSLGIDGDNMTRLNVWRRDHAYQEIGNWDGREFRLFFDSSSREYNFSYEANETGGYVSFSNKDSSVVTWFVIASDGVIIEFTMAGQEILTVNHSLCDDPLPRSSIGCLVTMPSTCKDGDNFTIVEGLIPSSMAVIEPAPADLSECQLICASNCSCTAYAFSDDNGCEVFYGNKNDLKLKEIGYVNIYLRNDASKSGNRKRRLILLLTSVAVSSILLIMILLFWFCGKRKGMDWSQGGIKDNLQLLLTWLSPQTIPKSVIELGKKNDHDLPLLSFSCLMEATDKFSVANKLGEGGYGPVYKGKFQGHDIAVKRLSHNSEQGSVEFKNEVDLISNLQHRNLVKLLGCCIQRDEKILIYEYMPNKSLDSFIFDPLKRPILDWRKRRQIIEGIAQGLLYLHKYSRLRIIHRDMKTSNILLDENLNPKISDFGLARIFFDNESQAKTKRLAGTYGYMAPEYAVHGVFSTKSDVFSFGVIVLEIISGTKNSTFQDPDSSLNLLGYAWELWNTERHADLVDQTITGHSCSLEDVMLCIQVGLLCVQESAEDRPSISDVVSLLSSECVSLPAPKRPAFSTLLRVADDSESRRQRVSQNFALISTVEAR